MNGYNPYDQGGGYTGGYYNPSWAARRRQPSGAQYYPGGQQVQRTQPLRGGGEQVTSYYQQGPPAPRQAGFAGLRRAAPIESPFRYQREAQRMEQMFPGYAQYSPAGREAALGFMPQMEQGMIQKALGQYLSPEQTQYMMAQQYPENPWYQMMQQPQAGFGAPQMGRMPYATGGFGGTQAPNWQQYQQPSPEQYERLPGGQYGRRFYGSQYQYPRF